MFTSLESGCFGASMVFLPITTNTALMKSAATGTNSTGNTSPKQRKLTRNKHRSRGAFLRTLIHQFGKFKQNCKNSWICEKLVTV